jgi:hypothetical protein
LEWVGAARFFLPAGVVGAAHVFAVGLAEGDTLAGCEWDGHFRFEVHAARFDVLGAGTPPGVSP